MSYVERLMGANEEVLVRERQHVWVWIPRMVVAMIAVSAITVLTVFAAQQTKTQAVLLALALNLIPIIWFVSKFLDWMNEEYIVTNRRIVQTEGTINKNVIDSSLEKINDVVLTQSFLGRMLNYGDLEILTASQEGI
ncbi:MAG TPA: PH domain-containing protein, partial [Thermoflexales bacterium]|nr:PH domain-containing protein [Thermoflexales bacterium]